MGNKKKGNRFFRKIWVASYHMLKFLTREMWHIEKGEVKGIKRFYVNTLKSLYMAIQGFVENDLSSRASALTYSTVLAIVPLLAVLVSVAKGFGVSDTLQTFLIDYFPSHTEELLRAFDFVDNYLQQVKGGLFLGIGLIFLLYTVFSLLSTIENAFNSVWETTQGRSIKSKLTTYFAMLFLLPIFITVSSGITLTLSTIQNSFMKDYMLIGRMTSFLLHLAPFVLVVFSFVVIFMVLPNVKVHFGPALISGFLAGVAYQVFQMLYISGMLWISKYNAIYGSFAAFPLLLLWMQLTWLITLFCAKLCYSIQNVNKFMYEREVKSVSRRYTDFVTILIMSLIVQRFVNPLNQEPYTVDDLSQECRIPVKLTTVILRRLLELRLIVEVKIEGDSRTGNFYPAVDPETLTVGSLLQRLDCMGSENFKVDMEKYQYEWNLTLASRDSFMGGEVDTLLKNLPLGFKRKPIMGQA